jgi:5'-3' exonuclease
LTRKLLIVDFYALFHRSRSALMRATGGLTRSDGTPTTGTYGFTNNLLSVIDSVRPSHVVVCYDAGGNWRKAEDAEYKANRVKEETPEAEAFKTEARAALDEMLPAMGITAVGIRGYEADDAIFTLSRDAGAHGFDETLILTCDQDILQCVSPKVKVILFNSAKKMETLDEAGVEAKWGVHPAELPLVKALCGDTSDNIAGIKGVGKKTAAKIVGECGGSWKRILEHQKVAPHADVAQANLRLVASTYVGELDGADFNDFALGSARASDLASVFGEYEFSSLSKRLAKIGEALNIGKPKAAVIATAGIKAYTTALKQLAK